MTNKEKLNTTDMSITVNHWRDNFYNIENTNFIILLDAGKTHGIIVGKLDYLNNIVKIKSNDRERLLQLVMNYGESVKSTKTRNRKRKKVSKSISIKETKISHSKDSKKDSEARRKKYQIVVDDWIKKC